MTADEMTRTGSVLGQPSGEVLADGHHASKHFRANGESAEPAVQQPTMRGVETVTAREPQHAPPGTHVCTQAETVRQLHSLRHWRRVAFGFLLCAATLLAGYGGVRWWQHAAAWAKTDNAYLAGHIHQVSSRIAGTVKEVLVEENQMVQAGSPVAVLDTTDFEIKRQQALAQLAQARAQYEQAQAQISQAEAQVTRMRAQAGKATRDFDRAQALSRGPSGAISRQEFDDAQAASESAAAALEGAQSALQSARALAAAAQAQEKVAAANLQDAEQQLSYTRIVASASGRIGKKNLETGNRVQPGQALVALVEPEPWIIANFKETQLAGMKPGQRATIEVDAFPGRVFTGRLESLSPASGSQFALLPPDNATGNFTRIVQRIPVKIILDPESIRGAEERLVPGMSAIVEVRVGE